MKMKRKQFIALILSGIMIFSTNGLAFAETDPDTPTTEPVKIEKENEPTSQPKEEPKQEEAKKEESKQEEVKKEEPKQEEAQEENKEEQKTEEVKQEGEQIVSNQKTETKSRSVKAIEEPQTKEEKEVSYPFTVTINLHYKNADGDQIRTYTRTITKKNAEQDWNKISLSPLSNDYQISNTLKYKFVNWTGEGETYTKYQYIVKKGTDFTEATTLNYTANYKESRYIEIQPYFVYMTPNGEYTKTDYPKQSGWWGDSWSFTNKKLDNIVSGNTNFIYVPENTQYEYNGKWTNASGVEINGQTFSYENYTENTTVYYYAQYTKTPRCKVTINYIDNIARGSHQWATGEGTYFDGYSAIQDKDLKGIKEPADIPAGYTFKYWYCDFTKQNYEVGDDFTITKDQITEDKVINLVATYDYQPQIEVIYNYKENEEWKELSSGIKLQPINIYKDTPQSLKSIKYWFYDEESEELIPNGETISLPDIVPDITEKQNIVEQTNVYAHYYGVTFVDEDGQTVLKDRIEYQYDTEAADIEKPDEPTKKATAQYTYFFNGWMPEIANVIKEVIYKTTYRSEVNKYTVTWINEDGTILEVDKNVPYGETPVYNEETPTKKADAQYTYTFKEWSPEITPVSGNATYKATYTRTLNKYTVTWVNWDNTLLEQDLEVPYGETPSYDGDEPKREKTAQHNYTFIGWDPTVEPVSGNITYVAQYAQDINKFKVIWQNWDETILEIDEDVPYGDKPSYDGETPIKPGTAQFSYEFIGWDPEVCEVTDDIIYTAQYKEIVNTYTVTWVNYNNNILEKDLEVPYGEMPSYDGTTPKKAATSKYTYEFTGWSPKVVTVTEDAIYKATFKAVLIPTPPQPDPDPDQEEPETVTKTKTKSKTNNNNNNNTTWILGENAGMGDGIEYTPIPTVKAPLSNAKIPFAAPAEIGAWAFINLLTVLINFAISITLLLMIYINNRKEDEETEVKNKVFRRICTLIIAIISAIIFFITEDITLPMVFVDKWTILMVIILIINVAVAILSRKKEEEKEEE